ncbi:MAG: hypothetical protein K2L83_00560 [Muribaculaceae bacterium]|nr:hypothetical protein [Muribaculaceae bacterium]
MKKLIFVLVALLAGFGAAKAESEFTGQIMLTPYLIHDGSTPKADQILADKLNRIVAQYGIGASAGLESPFIITAHAIAVGEETTATVPPQKVVEISLTLYIGNGEEGVVFTTCNLNLRGVGKTTEAAYSTAFKRIKVDDPEITKAIGVARDRIAEYYKQRGPALINKAKQFAACEAYAEAYAVLLRIPPVCPQYNEAQKLILELIGKEMAEENRQLLTKARSAWSADPTENGARDAQYYIDQIVSPDEQTLEGIDRLLADMSSRLQGSADEERAASLKREEYIQQQRMAMIEGARRLAESKADSQPIYYKGVRWW